MKFVIERSYEDGKGICKVIVTERGLVLREFKGTNDECWEFVGEYVERNSVQNFSVIDVFGKQHDYFRLQH